MRLNGLTLALAALLAPAAALAQQPSPPAEAAPPPAGEAGTTVEPPSTPAVPAAPVPADATLPVAQEEAAPAAPQDTPAPATAPVAPAIPAAAEDSTPVAAPEAPVPETGLTTGTTRQATGTPDTAVAGDQAVAADQGAPTDATAQEGTADPATLAPTEAEKEFNEIYGQQYDPVADPSLPTPVEMPGAFDPWEKYNRKMHRFNNAVDRGVAKPLARGYVKVVPRPFRLGVSNFFSNLGQPVTALNALLQGKPKEAGQAMGRFLLNSTLGIGGIFDPARDAKIPHRNEDFGQTLGVWGWKRSRYFELPLFGPRTVRDVFGMVGDAPMSPLRRVEVDSVRIPLQGLQLVDLRSQLLSTDSLREGAEDDYTLVRDAWSQRRDYQIFGERKDDDDAGLPDYLLEGEEQPTVPVDAMPVPPTGGSD